MPDVTTPTVKGLARGGSGDVRVMWFEAYELDVNGYVGDLKITAPKSDSGIPRRPAHITPPQPVRRRWRHRISAVITDVMSVLTAIFTGQIDNDHAGPARGRREGT